MDKLFFNISIGKKFEIIKSIKLSKSRGINVTMQKYTILHGKKFTIEKAKKQLQTGKKYLQHILPIKI